MSDNSRHDFNFSFSMADKAFEEISLEHHNLNERITNIIDSEKFFINGFPVLKSIMSLSPEKNDLKKLAKAIDRLADLVDIFDVIERKMEVVQTVKNDPNWFTWTFGDFSKEIDKDIENFFAEEK